MNYCMSGLLWLKHPIVNFSPFRFAVLLVFTIFDHEISPLFSSTRVTQGFLVLLMPDSYVKPLKPDLRGFWVLCAEPGTWNSMFKPNTVWRDDRGVVKTAHLYTVDILGKMAEHAAIVLEILEGKQTYPYDPYVYVYVFKCIFFCFYPTRFVRPGTTFPGSLIAPLPGATSPFGLACCRNEVIIHIVNLGSQRCNIRLN